MLKCLHMFSPTPWFSLFWGSPHLLGCYSAFAFPFFFYKGNLLGTYSAFTRLFLGENMWRNWSKICPKFQKKWKFQQKIKKVARKNTKFHKKIKKYSKIFKNWSIFAIFLKNHLKSLKNQKKLSKTSKTRARRKNVAWEPWMAPGAGKKFPKYRGWAQNGQGAATSNAFLTSLTPCPLHFFVVKVFSINLRDLYHHPAMHAKNVYVPRLDGCVRH